MLCIIRGRSSAGSGCILSDFGDSSLDDTVSDRDTLSDCSVRYFCESASSEYPDKESRPTSSISNATNMADSHEIPTEDEIVQSSDKFAESSQRSIDNSLMASSIINDIPLDTVSTGRWY